MPKIEVKIPEFETEWFLGVMSDVIKDAMVIADDYEMDIDLDIPALELKQEYGNKYELPPSICFIDSEPPYILINLNAVNDKKEAFNLIVYHLVEFVYHRLFKKVTEGTGFFWHLYYNFYFKRNMLPPIKD